MARDMNARQIYLDHNVSTPIDPSVRAAMAPYLAAAFGNPSSGHWAGVPAREAVETARAQVAALWGCAPHEVVFTSGGTEANNAALTGAFFAAAGRSRHIVTTLIEHPAIIEPCRYLERLGATVTYVGVDATGMVDPDDIRRALRPDTILVSVTPTTRSGRSSLSRRSPPSRAKPACRCTATRRSRWASSSLT